MVLVIIMMSACFLLPRFCSKRGETSLVWCVCSELTVIPWADVRLFLKDLMRLADFPVMFIKYLKRLKTSQIQQCNGHIQARFTAEQNILFHSEQLTTNHWYLTTLSDFCRRIVAILFFTCLPRCWFGLLESLWHNLSFFLKGRPVHPCPSRCLTKCVFTFLPVFIPFCEQHHHFETFGLSVQTHW